MKSFCVYGITKGTNYILYKSIIRESHRIVDMYKCILVYYLVNYSYNNLILYNLDKS